MVSVRGRLWWQLGVFSGALVGVVNGWFLSGSVYGVGGVVGRVVSVRERWWVWMGWLVGWFLSWGAVGGDWMVERLWW